MKKLICLAAVVLLGCSGSSNVVNPKTNPAPTTYKVTIIMDPRLGVCACASFKALWLDSFYVDTINHTRTNYWDSLEFVLCADGQRDTTLDLRNSSVLEADFRGCPYQDVLLVTKDTTWFVQ